MDAHVRKQLSNQNQQAVAQTITCSVRSVSVANSKTIPVKAKQSKQNVFARAGLSDLPLQRRTASVHLRCVRPQASDPGENPRVSPDYRRRKRYPLEDNLLQLYLAVGPVLRLLLQLADHAACAGERRLKLQGILPEEGGSPVHDRRGTSAEPTGWCHEGCPGDYGRTKLVATVGPSASFGFADAIAAVSPLQGHLQYDLRG